MSDIFLLANNDFKTNQSNQNNQRYNDVLINLQDYMFTDLFIEKIIKISQDEKEKETIERKKEVYNNRQINVNTNDKKIYKNNNTIIHVKVNNLSFLLPKQKDTLFWCFYIMKYGDVEYEILDEINVVIEKKLKYECIEKVRQNKQLIKTYKYATMSHIENQLANEKNIDLQTFLILCVLENMNVLYIHNKTWFELRMNDSDNFFIINKLDGHTKHGYCCMSCKSSDPQMNAEMQNYKNTMFQIDNIEKPLKGLSSYKVSELVEICNKLGLNVINQENGKHKNKGQMYELLVQYFGL